MSWDFKEARVSWRNLMAILRDADEDTKHKFAYWVIGHFIMAGAIVTAFGWSGAAFCLGMVLWAASNTKGT